MHGTALVPATDGRDNPELALVARETSERVTAALAGLPVADQLLLTLRFEDDRTMAEIARIMGFATRVQVHRRLKGVLHALREVLARR